MMLLSRPTVGEAAEYNSACVNTLRRPSAVTNSPATRVALVAVLVTGVRGTVVEILVLLAVVIGGVFLISAKEKKKKRQVEGALFSAHKEVFKNCCDKLMLFNNIVLVELDKHYGGEKLSGAIGTSLAVYLLEAGEVAHDFYKLPNELKKHIQFYQLRDLGCSFGQASEFISFLNKSVLRSPEINPTVGMAAEAFDYFDAGCGEYAVAKIKEVIKIWDGLDNMSQQFETIGFKPFERD